MRAIAASPTRVAAAAPTCSALWPDRALLALMRASRAAGDGARGPRFRQHACSLRQRIPAIPQRPSGVLRTRRDAPSSHGRAPYPVSDRRRCAASTSAQRS
jgi:hypothetical protein